MITGLKNQFQCNWQELSFLRKTKYPKTHILRDFKNGGHHGELIILSRESCGFILPQ